jgi:hypothetical protein
MSPTSFNPSFVRSGGLSPVAVIYNRTVSFGGEIEGVLVGATRLGAVLLMIEGKEQVLNLVRQSAQESH